MYAPGLEVGDLALQVLAPILQLSLVNLELTFDLANAIGVL